MHCPLVTCCPLRHVINHCTNNDTSKPQPKDVTLSCESQQFVISFASTCVLSADSFRGKFIIASMAVSVWHVVQIETSWNNRSHYTLSAFKCSVPTEVNSNFDSLCLNAIFPEFVTTFVLYNDIHLILPIKPSMHLNTSGAKMGGDAELAPPRLESKKVLKYVPFVRTCCIIIENVQ